MLARNTCIFMRFVLAILPVEVNVQTHIYSTLASVTEIFSLVRFRERKEFIYPERLGPAIESQKTKTSKEVSNSSVTPTLPRKTQKPKGIYF